MKPCLLNNASARQAVAAFWRHLRKEFPSDARFLYSIVTHIQPLTDEEADGTLGEWFLSPIQSWEEQQQYNLLGDHGQGYGFMKLLDLPALTVAIVAHEMGHAFSTCEDQLDTNAPLDDWASEAAADKHAVRWGLLSIEEIHERHRCNFTGLEITGDGRACHHHGPPPGGTWFDTCGARWRLREDFVFESLPVDRSPGPR